MKYSTAWLKSEIEKKNHVEYFFFWGHIPKMNDVVDKSCFSQWYHSPFVVDGVPYLNAEQWMMAKKALLFNDEEVLKQILSAGSPAEAKALGREVRNFDSNIWNAVAYSIVVEGNKYKFSQHEKLKEFLLSTKNKILVEASPADTIWGIGLPQDNSKAYNPFDWRGLNWLGFALMEVRDLLKQK